MDFKNVARLIVDGTKKHSPELLVALGIAGFVGTVVVAIKTTPKALDIIESEERAVKRPLRRNEKFRVTWKVWLPVVITGTAAIACVVGGTAQNCKIKAGLAAAYTASEQTMKIYREKVIDAIGEKKEKLVQDEVAKERIKRDPVQNREVIITPKGKTLCYEPLSGRYFESDIEHIRRAVEELNRRIRDEYYVDLNEWYSLLEIPQNDLGDQVGWNSDDYPLDPRYSSQLAEDDRPCLVVDVGSCSPRYDYRKQY